MSSVTLSEIIPILQLSISPVALISGVGLLLLMMTNRLGRVVDRARLLARERSTLATGHERLSLQIQILLLRADLLRKAIVFAAFSALFAAVLVITMFLAGLFRWGIAWLISLLFIACMGCLIISLVFFIRDLNHSLTALRIDVG
ncbi:MAG: DUF2721 domain-containing protein [Anaerolineae bacterium]|nr:DUF2721 domain-containing protein [Anaerolineae bacterium]MCX8068395.1 DUF2721 domain-containing protein [Anaerolineae bacterium]MDW7992723.1 DUF2721 domain-containing protein [Anaerolineae bacterium]